MLVKQLCIEQATFRPPPCCGNERIPVRMSIHHLGLEKASEKGEMHNHIPLFD